VQAAVRCANGAQLRGKRNRSLKPIPYFQSIGLTRDLRFPRATLVAIALKPITGVINMKNSLMCILIICVCVQFTHAQTAVGGRTKATYFIAYFSQLTGDGPIVIQDKVYTGLSLTSATVVAAPGRKVVAWVIAGLYPTPVPYNPSIWRRERNVTQNAAWTTYQKLTWTNQVVIDHPEVKPDEYQYMYQASSDQTLNGPYKAWCLLRLRSNHVCGLKNYTGSYERRGGLSPNVYTDIVGPPLITCPLGHRVSFSVSASSYNSIQTDWYNSNPKDPRIKITLKTKGWWWWSTVNWTVNTWE
jgi:hypothetical protein